MASPSRPGLFSNMATPTPIAAILAKKRCAQFDYFLIAFVHFCSPISKLAIFSASVQPTSFAGRMKQKSSLFPVVSGAGPNCRPPLSAAPVTGSIDACRAYNLQTFQGHRLDCQRTKKPASHMPFGKMAIRAWRVQSNDIR